MLFGFAGIAEDLAGLATVSRQDGSVAYTPESVAKIKQSLAGKVVYSKSEMDPATQVPVPGVNWTALVVDGPNDVIAKIFTDGPTDFEKYIDYLGKGGYVSLMKLSPPAVPSMGVAPLAVIGAVKEGDARLPELSKESPIYSEPRWYHMLGLNETGGTVVMVGGVIVGGLLLLKLAK